MSRKNVSDCVKLFFENRDLNSILKRYVRCCHWCNTYSDFVSKVIYESQKKLLCGNCIVTCTRICGKCLHAFIINGHAKRYIDGTRVCDRCYRFTGDRDFGDFFYRYY